MSTLKILIAGIILKMILLAPYSFAASQKFKIDTSHTKIEFEVSHMMISSVTGHFRTFNGTFSYDADEKKLNDVNVTIESNSIDTNNEKRDEHLKGPDFFDTTKYPQITFKSQATKLNDKGEGEIEGNLNMHGVEKKITLKLKIQGPVNDPWGNQMYSFEASSTIDRMDYGVSWNKSLDKGGIMVGKEVSIEIKGEANPAS